MGLTIRLIELREKAATRGYEVHFRFSFENVSFEIKLPSCEIKQEKGDIYPIIFRIFDPNDRSTSSVCTRVCARLRARAHFMGRGAAVHTAAGKDLAAHRK